MNGHTNDRRETPYTNSKAFNPLVIWGVAGGLILNIVGVTYWGAGVENKTEQNAREIMHVQELQDQQNRNIEKAVDGLKEDNKEIKRLLRQLLREQPPEE